MISWQVQRWAPVRSKVWRLCKSRRRNLKFHCRRTIGNRSGDISKSTDTSAKRWQPRYGYPRDSLEDRAADATIARIGATARCSATTSKSLLQTVLKRSGACQMSFLATSQPDSIDTGTTIAAGPEASLRVLSPSTTIISLGTEGTDTIFAARAMASDQPIRRSLSATTGLCQAGS